MSLGVLRGWCLGEKQRATILTHTSRFARASVKIFSDVAMVHLERDMMDSQNCPTKSRGLNFYSSVIANLTVAHAAARFVLFNKHLATSPSFSHVRKVGLFRPHKWRPSLPFGQARALRKWYKHFEKLIEEVEESASVNESHIRFPTLPHPNPTPPRPAPPRPAPPHSTPPGAM